MRKHHYTTYEIEWLKSQPCTLTYKELAEKFNTHFGCNVSHYSLSDLFSKRLKLKLRGANISRGQFKKGKKPKYEVGAEIIKGGYIWVKVDDKYFPGFATNNKDYCQNWKRKADIIWEKEYGEIPKGKFLIFLDKNPLNCELDNLYLTDRKTHAVMAKHKWYTEHKEVTKTAIELCKLMQALRRSK